jgi:hypothetical protein
MPTLNGDSQASSYGWDLSLKSAVANGETVDIPAPGFDLRYTDTRYPKLLVRSAGSSTTYTKDDEGVVVAFTEMEAAPKATITNQTGKDWSPGDELYLFCPHVLSHADNDWDLREQIWDLQQRVSVLEGGGAKSDTKLHLPNHRSRHAGRK